MKTKSLLLLVALAFAFTANAQEMAIKKYGFWDNWFIQGQVGASYTVGEADFSDLISPAAALSVGKYFSPYMGARGSLSGWKGKGGWDNNANQAGMPGTYDWDFAQLNLDALANLSNIFFGNKENRFFTVVALFGVGYNHSGNYDPMIRQYGSTTNATDNVVARAGLQTNFRLSHALDLNLEFNANALNDHFNRKDGSVNDWYYNLFLGLTYKFKNRGFEMVEVKDEALIRSLNDKINEQREIIDNIKPCPEPEPCPEPKVIENTRPEMMTVLFRINNSKVHKDQQVNLYTIAQYMKNHPDSKAMITGYADKNTGTAEYNMMISQKRAEQVYKILVDHYGIDESRLTVDAKGSDIQPFEENNWNRVVIITAD